MPWTCANAFDAKEVTLKIYLTKLALVSNCFDWKNYYRLCGVFVLM